MGLGGTRGGAARLEAGTGLGEARREAGGLREQRVPKKAKGRQVGTGAETD